MGLSLLVVARQQDDICNSAQRRQLVHRTVRHGFVANVIRRLPNISEDGDAERSCPNTHGYCLPRWRIDQYLRLASAINPISRVWW